MNATRVSGTVTFQSEADGTIRTVRFPSFKATTETPYVDLVDEATALSEDRLPKLDPEYGWVQINENLREDIID